MAKETKASARFRLPQLILVLVALPLLSATTPQRCTPVPAEPPRDTSCDDGTEPMCNTIPPDCDEWEILAHQDSCYVCVNPDTCQPWGVPECRGDAMCAPSEYCDGCGTSSCPFCDDCVAACRAHGCPTEAAPTCRMMRPQCAVGQVSIVRDGCWVCVSATTCEPVDPGRDTSCDDGTTPICLMVPPTCSEYEILAYQFNCYECVNPATCLPWGMPECHATADCPPGEYCDACGTSSCPFCDDCVSACVGL